MTPSEQPPSSTPFFAAGSNLMISLGLLVEVSFPEFELIEPGPPEIPD